MTGNASNSTVYKDMAKIAHL